MGNFKLIKPEELANNPFKMIGTEWMLIAAEKEGKINAMTASWGGLGILWNKPVAFIFIRQTRYTKEFVDSNERLTLNFFEGEFKKELGYFGRVSGRDEDKIKVSGMEVSLEDGLPIFEKAKKCLICKKLYTQKLEESSFLDKRIKEQFYTNDTMHSLYVAEIEKVLAH
ncbi:MAG: flavin reductase [Fibrobacter sp.]|nr:flavin reductase [Fibrobacter sp.]